MTLEIPRQHQLGLKFTFDEWRLIQKASAKAKFPRTRDWAMHTLLFHANQIMNKTKPVDDDSIAF